MGVVHIEMSGSGVVSNSTWHLRIGHTYFTLGYLLRGEPVPEWIPCASTLTVKHILIGFVDFSETRNDFYTTNTLKELFEKVPSNKIIDYVKAIGIYNLI